MGPTVIITVGHNFGLMSPEKSYMENKYGLSKPNISKLCGYLLTKYPNLKYRVSNILPNVTVDVYELNFEELNDFLVDIRKLDYVEGAEMVLT